jgi:putative hemolysin
MDSIAGSILIMFFLFLLNGFFAMSEMAVVSSRKSKLKMLADEGHTSYKMVLNLVESPNRFLSSIQIGITLLGIISGAYGEAAIADKVAAMLQDHTWAHGYGHIAGVIIVIFLITMFSIVFGELLPKRIALINPEIIASKIVYPIRAISILFLPFVHILGFFTNAILNLFNVKPKSPVSITYDEIKFLLQEGVEYGIFRKQQKDMLVEIMELQKTDIVTLMQPRTNINFIDAHNPMKLIKESVIGFADSSYLPVCNGGIDNVVGTINTRLILKKLLSSNIKNITKYMEKPLFIPENTNALKALELFKTHKTHVGYVVDEYGSVIGLVTLNDISEEIIGNIPQSYKRDRQDIIQRTDGSYLVNGILPTDDFEKKFRIAISNKGKYQTLAGFVMHYLEHVPKEGENFMYRKHRFEVIDMDGNKIDKVLVKKSR